MQFGWIQLQTFGNSSVLKSSRLWLILVPLAVKALEASPNPLVIPSIGVSLNLDLPFSWKIFYFSSVAFAVAGLIFDWRCPPLVKDYDGFPAYNAQQFDPTRLSELLIAFNPIFGKENLAAIRRFLRHAQLSPLELDDLIKRFHEADTEFATDIERASLVNRLRNIQVDENHEGSAFHFVRSLASSHFPVSLAICTIAYVTGFLLLGWVLIQNFCYVVSHI